MPMDARSQRRRQADRTRSQILVAAARHFAERGFAAARLEDVAGEVGIGRSAVLYHFKDKRLVLVLFLMARQAPNQ